MKILVVGGGGREHAMAWAVARSPRCDELFVAPGNAGTPGTRVAIAATDVEALVAFCRSNEIDLVLVGPDAAVAAGLVDALDAVGVAAFGPTKAASELEWSKSFCREFADRHGIASPRFARFDEAAAARAWFESCGFPVVVKADGLAAGKGVVVPDGHAETLAAIDSLVAGGVIVLEERLVGEEVSVLAFCDGTHVSVMPPAQDHKRAHEGDRGPNTGGMGAYAPAPVCPPALLAQIVDSVLQPAVTAMAAEGRPYRGVLYAGLMLTADGPRLLEFNCRFGDPEAQAILALLDSDLVDVALACVEGRLAHASVRWRDGAALSVVLAADGYPGSPRRGDVIHGLDGNLAGALVFHAGTERDGDHVVTAGGRVLSVTGLGTTVNEARDRAYRAAETITFAGRQMRRDIGWRAIARTVGGYAASGVDIAAGNRAVDLMKQAVTATHTSAVVAGVGSFGGVIDVSALKSFDAPVLVASTDGVGTKVMVATAAGRPETSGIDIVNHCIDDVLVQNARPLFFLDYIAASRLDPEHVAAVVTGMATACKAAGCVLLGGETAEMPGVYADGHFDVAGTLVGVADRASLLPRSDVGPGDILIGLASSGPHTSGYSLLRRIFAGLPLDAMPEPLEVTLADALLEPHRSYLDVLVPVLDGMPGTVKALIHITGGGLVENPPRILPDGCGIEIELGSWPVPALFRLVRDVSGLPADELHRTLNMGIGMVLVVAPEHVGDVQAKLGEDSWVIGKVTVGAVKVVLV